MNSPLALAGLTYLGSNGQKDIGTALTESAAAIQDRQYKQAQLAEIDRTNQMRAKLPELIGQVDLTNPQASLVKLIQMTGSPQVASQIVKTALDAQQENRLAQTADRNYSIQQQGLNIDKQQLDLKRQALEFERMGGGESTASMRNREQKIQEMQALHNVDRATAAGIADGYIKTVTDPVNGNTTLVNMATGTVKNLAPSDAPRQEEEAMSPIPDGLYSKTSATGVIPAIKAGYDRTVGQLSGNVDAKNIKDRQALRNASSDLIRALSINPRYPVGEIERLKENIDIEPAMLDSPAALTARMEATAEYLTNRMKDERRAASDSTLPSKVRQDAAAAAKDIANFLNKLGKPNPAGNSNLQNVSDDELLKMLD